MALRKYELMYNLFGQADGICKDCQHYTAYRYRDKPYRKCEVYGVTNSEATDWKANAQSCGLYPDKPYSGRNIIELVRGGKQAEDWQIDGQITMEGLI